MRLRAALLLCASMVWATTWGCRGGGGSPATRSARSGAELGPSVDAGADDASFAPCSRDAKQLSGCREECDRSVASSCAILGAKLAEGIDNYKDLPESLRAWERACEAGDALACVSASRMWASGQGAPPSRERQLDRLGKACELGDATSCMTAARAYARGRGVAEDASRARRLFERACGGGIEQGCDALGLDAGG